MTTTVLIIIIIITLFELFYVLLLFFTAHLVYEFLDRHVTVQDDDTSSTYAIIILQSLKHCPMLQQYGAVQRPTDEVFAILL